MANYIKSTDFAAKDTLAKGDPNKKIVGSEINTEFNNIEEAIRTKIDRVSVEKEGNFPAVTHTGQLIDSGYSPAELMKFLIPTGTVFPYASDLFVPEGFLLCQGQAVSRNTYSDLFLVLGTRFGAGNGTTTFNLPNLVGRTPIGAGPAQTGITARTVGQKGGTEKVILEQKQLPKITGGILPVARSDRDLPSVKGVFTKSAETVGTGFAGGSITGRGVDFDLGGEDKPHENMQPFLVLNFIIKY